MDAKLSPGQAPGSRGGHHVGTALVKMHVLAICRRHRVVAVSRIMAKPGVDRYRGISMVMCVGHGKTNGNHNRHRDDQDSALPGGHGIGD
jgi:hypothetical protein